MAYIWSVAHTKDQTSKINERPVMFFFNVDPESDSHWLQRPLFGTKLAKVDSNAKKDDGAAPFELIRNNNSLLDKIDIVFIDLTSIGQT